MLNKSIPQKSIFDQVQNTIETAEATHWFWAKLEKVNPNSVNWCIWLRACLPAPPLHTSLVARVREAYSYSPAFSSTDRSWPRIARRPAALVASPLTLYCSSHPVRTSGTRSRSCRANANTLGQFQLPDLEGEWLLYESLLHFGGQETILRCDMPAMRHRLRRRCHLTTRINVIKIKVHASLARESLRFWRRLSIVGMPPQQIRGFWLATGLPLFSRYRHARPWFSSGNRGPVIGAEISKLACLNSRKKRRLVGAIFSVDVRCCGGCGVSSWKQAEGRKARITAAKRNTSLVIRHDFLGRRLFVWPPVQEQSLEKSFCARFETVLNQEPRAPGLYFNADTFSATALSPCGRIWYHATPSPILTRPCTTAIRLSLLV